MQDERLIRRVAMYSLLLNIGLVIAKLFLASVAGSLSLRADAIHSLVDVFASVALIVGLEISGRKSRRFPYGLYKVENVASVVISLLLFLTAYEIAAEAAYGNTAQLPAYEGWVLWAVAALIPVPLIFGSYQIKVGRMFGSPSLTADGVQHRADVLTSALVFLALIAQRSSIPLDKVASIIIAVFIVKEGWEILESGMKVLLDASVDSETREKIGALIMDEPEVSELVEVTARNSGRYLFVEADLTLRVNDLKRAHLVSVRIEDKIKKAVPNVDRVLIRYKPRSEARVRCAVPLSDAGGRIGQHFGESPYFALIDIDTEQGKLQRQEVVSNPYKDLEKGKGLKVAKFIIGYKPDLVVTKEGLEGKGPGYAFAEAGVETVQTSEDMLNELIEKMLIADGDPGERIR